MVFNISFCFVIVVVKFWSHPRWWHVSSPSNSPRYIRAFLRSPCYSWHPPGPLRSQIFSASKTPALNQATLATVHPRSLPTITSSIFPTFITCDTTQREQLWTMANCLHVIQTSQHHCSRCYNKWTCANRSVTKISSGPSATCCNKIYMLDTNYCVHNPVYRTYYDTNSW